MYCDLEIAEPTYIKPLDWWLEQVPEGHVLQLLKAIYTDSTERFRLLLLHGIRRYLLGWRTMTTDR